ncbi:MAG: CoA-binding protein [Acidobacteriota bacterium]|nr:CoA-binding protein [Acidobacteriota bacterium]
MNEPETIADMLGDGRGTDRVIAVVGLSDNPARPSHSVSAYMQRHGYRILPVNPQVQQVLGERSYARLEDLPEPPDVVNVFRLPGEIPGIVESMIALGLRNLWVQAGIVNEQAARRAEAAGIRVVMDRCILVEHGRRFS